jgi:hypothetical protein
MTDENPKYPTACLYRGKRFEDLTVEEACEALRDAFEEVGRATPLTGGDLALLAQMTRHDRH